MFRLTKSVASSMSVAPNYRLLSLFHNHLELESGGAASPLKFHYYWLRDHCRCSECYNYSTHQINTDLLQIPFDIKPKSCREDADKLEIIWPDEHKTEYSINFLRNLMQNRRKPLKETVYWDNAKLASIEDATMSCEEYFESENGKRKLLSSILKYGFGLVTGVKPTLEATEELVRHTTLIQKTIYGEMWEVTAGGDVEDTAYSTIALDAHNDTTYFSEAPGLMVFHLLERSGTGGKTLLVDGFNAANNLRKTDAKAFEILSSHPIESEFIGKNIHFASVEPVIKLHPVTRELMQIRFNTYDRAYLNTLQFENIMDFYKAYTQLASEIKKESNQWWIQLNPGTVLFFDNWRLLHGRGEFTGHRRLTGCYVARRDWTSAAKQLGLPLY